MVSSCQTIVFMHDPTIEAFLRITESCTGVNSSLWLRWNTVNSDRARRVMFSNARSSCLVDKVIKQKRQRALILLVFVRFWNSSTSIKLWSWSDAKTAASCGFSSWCKSADQQLCSFFFVCLAVCSHLASLECYCRSSLIPTMSVIQKVRGNVRKYRVSFFFIAWIPHLVVWMLADELVLEVYAAEPRTQNTRSFSEKELFRCTLGKRRYAVTSQTWRFMKHLWSKEGATSVWQIVK